MAKPLCSQMMGTPGKLEPQCSSRDSLGIEGLLEREERCHRGQWSLEPQRTGALFKEEKQAFGLDYDGEVSGGSDLLF